MRSTLMGFLLRSAFWLGLVFHAMPWGDARLTDAVPVARDALVAGLATQTHDGTATTLANAVLRAAFDPQSATAPKVGAAPERSIKPRRPSVDTLSAADRQPPWRGLGLRSTL